MGYKTNRKTQGIFKTGNIGNKGKYLIPEIHQIKVTRTPDEDTDISYLGSFSDSPGKWAIDFAEIGETDDRITGGYKYFNADNVDTMEDAMKQWEAARKYQTGDVMDYIIQAEAEIYVPDGRGAYTIQRVHSGALGGIQSNSGDKYIRDIENEQIDDLVKQLKAFGITISKKDARFQAVRGGE